MESGVFFRLDVEVCLPLAARIAVIDAPFFGVVRSICVGFVLILDDYIQSAFVPFG